MSFRTHADIAAHRQATHSLEQRLEQALKTNAGLVSELFDTREVLLREQAKIRTFWGIIRFAFCFACLTVCGYAITPHDPKPVQTIGTGGTSPASLNEPEDAGPPAGDNNPDSHETRLPALLDTRLRELIENRLAVSLDRGCTHWPVTDDKGFIDMWAYGTMPICQSP